MKTPAALFTELIEIIEKLRGPEGCPWDKKQSPQSLKPYLLEETHELAEAIDAADGDHIKEELGDLFFQISFLALLHQEKKQFTIADSLQGIIDKMVRRHPHVFTDEVFASDEAIRQNWQKIKAQEKKEKKKQDKGELIDVPKSLPALNRAQRVSSRAASHGFEWPDTASLLNKFREEAQELVEAVEQGNRQEISEEIGDLFFMLINICRWHDLYGEDIMHLATDKFIRRYTMMEELIRRHGSKMTEMASEQHLHFWRQAKEKERD
ncbi:MAG: nucleoside triphosphate pyrophosphohydrolase [Desulfobulbaceae bacterium]|nr:MAG: nucleoside triphosphate pyrophosphohydrolase [Desulfobulbaceae bacterium]